MISYKDLSKKENKDLHKLLAEHREQLRALRFKVANNQLKDVSQMNKTKKTIARILTILNQQEKEESSN
jgi:ribosomal protein L29